MATIELAARPASLLAEPAARRGATVDGDEHLAAYNSHLARLAGRDPGAPAHGKD